MVRRDTSFGSNGHGQLIAFRPNSIVTSHNKVLKKHDVSEGSSRSKIPL